ncbi:hypothetical protein [Acidilobus sp. 7A]|nr:hypothetical protein [Acidilobus sp. 7A]
MSEERVRELLRSSGGSAYVWEVEQDLGKARWQAPTSLRRP